MRNNLFADLLIKTKIGKVGFDEGEFKPKLSVSCGDTGIRQNESVEISLQFRPFTVPYFLV